jgi:hypothetical protein
MEKVREKYKRDSKTKRPFPLEHWWKMVRQHGKWKRLNPFEEINKRNKLDAMGGYSSSNKDTDEGEFKIQRPQGQKAAKGQWKGKGKCFAGNLTNKNVEQFNELQLRKSLAAEKTSRDHMWERETLAEIIYTCIILHNMIIEDERDDYVVRYDLDYEPGNEVIALEGLEHGPIHGFNMVLEAHAAIRDRPTHRRLKGDLIEHIWLLPSFLQQMIS